MCAVAEIITDASMKMDVDQAGDGVATGSVDRLASGLFCKDAIFNQDVLLDEHGVLGKDLRVFDDHSGTSGKKEFAGAAGRIQSVSAPVRRRRGAAPGQISERAASSPTKVTWL